MDHAAIHDIAVVAPARRLSAVRDRLPAIQYHQKNEDVILATPCPTSSLFGDILLFPVYERYFATDIVCVNPTKAISQENRKSSTSL